MDPFEDLMHQLSDYIGVSLHPDSHQSCLIQLSEEGLSVQIDLDTNADKILVGTELGPVGSGSYRERMLKEAMIANGSAKKMQGILAFSEKNDSLVLFQFLPLAKINGEKLYRFLETFLIQAKMWRQAIASGNVPNSKEFAL